MPRPNKAIPIVRYYIGEWIEALGMERRKVIAKAGITESYLSLLINNHKRPHPKSPSADVMDRIADALGVPLSMLRKPPPHTIEEARQMLQALDDAYAAIERRLIREWRKKG